MCPFNYDNPFFDFIVMETKTSGNFLAKVIAVKEMNQRLAVEMRNQNDAHARKKPTMLTKRRKIIRNGISSGRNKFRLRRYWRRK